MIAGRAEVIEQVVEQLLADHPGDQPLRIGVDGITAAGKTTWARELTGAIQARGRFALHVSTDDFHSPRARRHRQGGTSAAGYRGRHRDRQQRSGPPRAASNRWARH